MKYKVVILDLDNTLIDFDYMEVESLKHTLEHFNVTWTDEMIEDYILINQALWERLEKGEHTKEEILLLRFKTLADRYGMTIDPVQVNEMYLKGMKDHTMYMPHGKELLDAIKGKTCLVMLTNGVTIAQKGKVEKLGLDEYFDHIIISEAVKLHKPDVRIFEYMSKQIGMYDKEEMIIIGDSLTSDIQGGINYGIDTCWYNPKKKASISHVNADYTIQSLEELWQILEL